MLGLAADAFIVRTPAGPDVVAGYPWFGAWSRDTMIAYEGLFLSTGRADEGRELLRTYAGTLSDGMLANTADTGQIEYNTADATLWFLHAVDRHLAATGDTDLAAELVEPLDDVVAGTWPGPDTASGSTPTVCSPRAPPGTRSPGWTRSWAGRRSRPGPARRWSSTRCGSTVSRLWPACADGSAGPLATWTSCVPPRPSRSSPDSRRRAEGFMTQWTVRAAIGSRCAPTSCWRTVCRTPPFAAQTRHAVREIGRTLLTPLGPRTLAPGEPGYRGRHRGDPGDRDRAYHQGTVWPWLIGPYADAVVAAGLPTDGILDGLLAHLGEWGIGSVSETADGDPPHAATGCPFQAWSVAEVLRACQADRSGCLEARNSGAVKLDLVSRRSKAADPA